MKKLLRRTWKLILVAGLFVLALLVFIQTSAFDRWLLRRAESYAHMMGLTFSASEVHLDLRHLRASLTNVYFSSGGLQIKARRVFLDVPHNILTSQVRTFTHVEIDEAAITLVSSESVIPEPSGEPTPLPCLQFDDLIVRKSSFSYTNQRTSFLIPEFSLNVAGNRGALRLTEAASMPPDLKVDVREIPFTLASDGLQFGPSPLGVAYGEYSGKGTTEGRVLWFPTLAVDLTFATEPVSFSQWKQIEASGAVHFLNGILKIDNFNARQGGGSVTGSAEISDKGKKANVAWSDLRLDPSGVSGETSGKLQLNWTASDFSDASGVGAVDVSTAKYGNATSSVKVDKGLARFDLRATSYDVQVQGNVTTGLDRKLAGSFIATQDKHGLVTLEGKVAGTWSSPLVDGRVKAENLSYAGVGPIAGAAKVSLRDKVLSVTEITAAMMQSRLENAFAVIDLKTNAISAEVPRTDIYLEDLARDASGQAVVVGQVSGSLEHPVAMFTAESSGFDIGGTHIDSASAVGSYSDDILYVDELVARQAQGEVFAQGTVDTRSREVCATIDGANLQIVDVRGFSTTAFLAGTVYGTLDDPVGEFKGELQNVVYKGEPHGNLVVNGDIENNIATIRAQSEKYTADAVATVALKTPYPVGASIVARQSAIHYKEYDFVADGVLRVTAQVEPLEIRGIGADGLSVKGEGLDLTATGSMDGSTEAGIMVAVKANLAEAPLDKVRLIGSAQGNAVISGFPNEPQVQGALETTDASVQVEGMPEPVPVVASIDFTKDRFEIRSLRAQVGDGIVTATGSGTLKGADSSFEFEAKDIRPERFLANRPVEGFISANGKATLTAPSIEGLSANAEITRLDLNVRGIDIQQTEPAAIAIANQTLSVNTLRLKGSDTDAVLHGTANLKTGDLAFEAEANTDLRLLEAFVPDSIFEGRLDSKVTVGGTTEKPDLNGHAEISKSVIQIAEPPIDIDGFDASIQLRGDRIEVARAEGNLNGGHFTVSGGAGVSSNGLNNASVHFKADGVQFEYPEGLESAVNADLMLAGTVPSLAIQGQVDVVNALYREDIDLKQEIFTRVTNASEMESVAGTGPAGWSKGVGLDIDVDTAGLVTVTNNLANLDLTGSFRVRGTVASPIVLGRAAVNEGGELYFGAGVARGGAQAGERRDRYVIDRGTLEFNNPLRTDPQVDFEATHELNVQDERYLITLRATGPLVRVKTELTSDPPLPERDIVTMLLTGRTFTEVQSEYRAAASEQLANYFSGELSSFFSTAGTALGLDTLRFDPVTLAQEEDLSARLTLGKRITRNFTFSFSQNLRGSRSQAWILDYNTFKNYVIRAVNEMDDRQVRLEFRQDLRLGGGPALPRRVRPQNEPILKSVAFTGTSIDVGLLQKKVARPGDPFGAYRLNDSVRKLRTYFTSRDYLDVRIRPMRSETEDGVDVEFVIQDGPRITFTYEGASVPKKVDKEVKQIWIDGVTEATSLRASTALLLRHFRDDGYLQAQVSSRDDSPDRSERRYAFVIEPGTKYEKPEWRFTGTEPIDLGIDAGEALANPETVRQRIEADLRDKGFIAAKASVPQLVIVGKQTWLDVNVERGPQFSVSNLVFEGNAFFTPAQLQRVVVHGPSDVIPKGEGARPSEVDEELKPFPFTSTWMSTAAERLQAEYWQQGFNDFEIEPSTNWDKDKGTVTARFKITEGPREVLESVSIEGADHTKSSYILRQFMFKEGDPADYSRINLTRKKLYDTGLFKRVDIDVEAGNPGYEARVRLNEDALWRIRYGVAVGSRLETNDRQIGVTGDITRMNLWGKGISSGISLKAQEKERDARLFWSFPLFLNREIRTTGAVFRTRDILPTSTDNFLGATIQQLRRLSDFYVLTYDFSYKKVHSDGPAVIDGTVPDRFSLARFNVTLTRDTRDDILNATTGQLFSNSFEIAPPGVGSTFRYFRNFSQYLKFRRVHTNMVWASAVRVGFGGGLGGDPLVSTERFLAGGGSTLRAFRQDELTPEAGNATLILNQEIRMPLFWRIGGVAFFDAGNVYRSAGTLRAWQLRYSPGVGLRVNTPFVLLRFDMGLNLAARAGEPPRRFVFGIGQAF